MLVCDKSQFFENRHSAYIYPFPVVTDVYKRQVFRFSDRAICLSNLHFNPVHRPRSCNKRHRHRGGAGGFQANCCLLYTSNFLHIQLCAHGKVGGKHRIAVFVTSDGFDQTALRNLCAVSGYDILGGEQTELHRQDFAVCADPEGFVPLHHFG